MSFAPVGHTPSLVFSWSSFKGSFTVQQVPWVGGLWAGWNKWKFEALLLRKERCLHIGVCWRAGWWKSCSLSVNIFWLFASSLLIFVWHVKCVCVCVCVFIFKVFNTVRLEINIQWQTVTTIKYINICHFLTFPPHHFFLKVSTLSSNQVWTVVKFGELDG